jgi:hypothetical protein
VLDSNGYFYRSLANSNLNNTPSDNPDKWGVAILATDLVTATLTHDMTSDADYTLTTAENRYGRVIITDTGVVLTTGRNIIVSDTERSFFAQNDTLQTLTYKTSAGTGIPLSPGQSQILGCDGTNVTIFDENAISSRIQPVDASVAANALTVTINPTVLDFRSSTLTDGTVNTRIIPSAISMTVSSGSTLGTISGAEARLAILAIDNAGTIEAAIVNLAGDVNIDETTLISTTAEGGAGGADSADVVYSTTARSNVPFRVVGFIDITEATAGTWATGPTTIQGVGGNAQEAIRNSTQSIYATGGTETDLNTIFEKRLNTTFTANGSIGLFTVGASINATVANACDYEMYIRVYDNTAAAPLGTSVTAINSSSGYILRSSQCRI